MTSTLHDAASAGWLAVVPQTSTGGTEALLIVLAVGGGVCLLLFAWAVRRALFVFSDKHVGPPLIIQEAKIIEARSDGPLILLQGRPEGFFSWALNLVGLGTVVRLEVTAEEVTKRAASLSRRAVYSVPCRRVASAEYGLARSPLRLLLAALCLFLALAAVAAWAATGMAAGNGAGLGGGAGGAPEPLGQVGPAPKAGGRADPAPPPPQGGKPAGTPPTQRLCLVAAVVWAGLALVFFLAYWLSKRLMLEVESQGGRRVGIVFRPSLMEGAPLDLAMTERIVAIISNLSTPEERPAGRLRAGH